MTEFMEVAREKKRMCAYYHKRDCYGCPLNDEEGNCGILNVRYSEDEAIKCIEETVMEWAKEHPEPVEVVNSISGGLRGENGFGSTDRKPMRSKYYAKLKEVKGNA